MLRVYGLGLILGLLLYSTLTLGGLNPALTDGHYLQARYAQNLLDGEGLVFNPDERYLLTSAPLIVFGQALFGLIGFASDTPLLACLLLGLSIAGVMRFLSAGAVGAGYQVAICGAMAAAGLFLRLDAIDWGLLALSLLSLELLGAENLKYAGRWVGLLAGLMLLISPAALIFILLLGLIAPKSYWRWVFLPAILFYGCALVYFGESGLRALTLTQWEGMGFTFTFTLGLIALALLAWFVLKRPKLPLEGYLMLTWGVAYGLYLIWFGAPLASQNNLIAPPPSGATVGYIGDYQTAYRWGGVVYHLEGRHNPHLRDLYQGDGLSQVLIATAPDYVLGHRDLVQPFAALFDRLAYVPFPPDNMYWRRAVEVGKWEALAALSRSLNYSLGDLQLLAIAQDALSLAPDGRLRLRLDWAHTTNKRPDADLLIQFQMLDYQGAVWGGVEKSFPPQVWQGEELSTYHVLSLAANAPYGLYRVQLNLGYNAGWLGREIVTEVKVPAPYTELDQSPLARFDDGHQAADLISIELEQDGDVLNGRLLWRVERDFENDYSIFVHLTEPNRLDPLAQADHAPADGRYPTHIWEQGEVIEDGFTMNISALPDGDYQIRIGFFSPQYGQIPMLNGGLNSGDNAFTEPFVKSP